METLYSEPVQSWPASGGVSGQLAPSFSGVDAAAWPRDSVGPSTRRGRTESPAQGPRRRPDLPPNCEAGWGCLVFNDRAWARWDVRKKQIRQGRNFFRERTQASHFCCPHGWGGMVGTDQTMKALRVGGQHSMPSGHLSRTEPHPPETAGLQGKGQCWENSTTL